MFDEETHGVKESEEAIAVRETHKTFFTITIVIISSATEKENEKSRELKSRVTINLD